jgi:proteasomal ATPase-associated factor 1
VSSGEAIATLFANGQVTAMSLGDRTPVPPDGEDSVPPPPGDQREVPETSTKLVFCALKNGSFQLLDLGFKRSTYVSPPSSPSLTSIAYLPSSSLLATGSSSGVVTLYDIRSFTNALTSFTRMESEIENIAFVSQHNGSGSVSLAIATSDGLPYVASIVPEGPAIRAELVGSDCDAVKHVATRNRENRTDIWSASDDGVVRRYIL